MTPTQPHFTLPIREAITNHLTGETLYLEAVDDAARYTPAHLEQIVAICNQPRVYDLLFAERLQGKPYPIADTETFIRWGEAGWRNQTHFLFYIVRADDTIVGAADIKSPNLAAAEIGYWLSEEHPGIMSNAVKKLCVIARQAGYRALFALVKEHNRKSSNVLERAGFTFTESRTLKEQPYRKYDLTLEQAEATPA